MALGSGAAAGGLAPAHTRALERLSDLTQHPDLQDDPQCLTALSVLVLAAGWSADPGRSRREESCLVQGVGRAVEALSTWQTAGSGHGVRRPPAAPGRGVRPGQPVQNGLGRHGSG